MKKFTFALALLLLAGCNQSPLGPTPVDAKGMGGFLVVSTEETSPGVWNDHGVLRICDVPSTEYFDRGVRIKQIAISADLPCPR